MQYKFTNKAGIVRAFNNQPDYLRAFENQTRVERLQELNRDIVYEEMLNNGESLGDFVRETEIAVETEAHLEDR